MFQIFRNKIRTQEGKVRLYIKPQDNDWFVTDPYPTHLHARRAYRDWVADYGLPATAYLEWEGGYTEHICN